jgi:hypothetical protein
MTAQEKLDKIDAMLYKAGWRQPGTFEKVHALLANYRALEGKLECSDRIIVQAQQLLEHGYIDD